MISDSNWSHELEFLRRQLPQFGFDPPEDLRSHGDFIRWLRGQQVALEHTDSRLASWPAMIDRLDEAGIVRATGHWTPTAHQEGKTPVLRLDPRLNTPIAGAVRVAFGAWAFARPDATGRALDALQRLRGDQKGRPLYVQFSPMTGLARSLAAESFTDGVAKSAGAMFEQARLFLRRYGGLLHGEAEGSDSKATRWREADAVGNVAFLQQLDANDIPVYSATTAFSFDDSRRLTFIQNGWYPLLPNVKAEPPRLSWSYARSVAIDYLGYRDALSKDAEVKTAFGGGSQEGRVRLPTLAKRALGDGPDDLFPLAWAVLIIDRTNGKAWEVLVDDMTGLVFDPHWRTINREGPEPELLELSSHAPVTVRAYGNNAAALVDKTALKAWASTGSPPPGWSSSAGTFAAEGEFPITVSGQAFQPPGPAAPLTLAALRSGHAYYHLCKAAEQFTQIRVTAWPAAIAPPPSVPGIDLPLPILMESSGISMYLPPFGAGSAPSGELHLRPGVGANIDDQVLDCEVLYHEYTHAMLYQVRRQIVENAGTGYLQTNFRPAVNEGLAFYFGTALAERLEPGAAPVRWGEYAYEGAWWQDDEPWHLEHTTPTKQQEGWDFLPVYESFPQLRPFPGAASSHHLCGMVLTRALWDLRRVLGPETADALVLRAMSMLGGIPDGMTPPAEAIQQRVRELYGEAYENALRLLWLGRGIIADAPVYALLRRDLAAHSYTFVAAARGGNGSGCFYIEDNATLWQSLGQGGPHEIVALAAAEVADAVPGPGQEAVLLFAAGDRWSPLGGGTSATDRLYWYALDPANFDPTASWQSLPWPLPSAASVLALTAQAGATVDAFSLFAATEDGVYRFDGRWQAGAVATNPGWSKIQNEVTFGLAAFGARNDPQLAVAGRRGGSVGGVNGGTKVTGSFNWGLCTAAAEDGHVWIGTAKNGIYHFDPGMGLWSQQGGALPPVLSLLLLDGAGANREILAGTSGGLYRWSGGAWVRLSLGVPLDGMVTCLGRDPVGQVLAVSESRGLLRLTVGLDDAAPFGDGIPRAGAVIDVNVPSGACPFSSTLLTSAFQQEGVATYVIYVPDTTCQHLRLRTSVNASTVEVYFSAPRISLVEGLWAGLQPRTLMAPASDNRRTMNGLIEAGYYLIVLRSGPAIPIPAGTIEVFVD